ncbi:hypothetical protein M422DRAFT_23262 [Sphaerobolus stellatus SS14]|nr:hypothetical protein M422DRAFT_23262 [Sphaerobolus stellatus SS14]
MSGPGERMNRLVNAKSPYLLQHATNPVDWYEWSEEAFVKAQTENKPIFLSVGYSACHWCHVLAHESFEDPEIARVMNENFVNIKVDREERPDVDRLYMTFVQATNGRGGWPMSVWLTPELAPFFAGMYFPKDTFKLLCERIAATWKADPEKVRKTGQSVVEQLQDLFKQNIPGISSVDIDIKAALEHVYKRWKEDFDPVNAGFGEAPKFPSPSMTFYPLLRFAHYTNNETEKSTAIEIVTRTLLAINRGGINDHVGKGIARYSVDAEWRLPHFEKMLYDQAQLTTYALECSTFAKEEHTKKELQQMAMDIIEYSGRDLRSPQGAFYSAEDADSLPYPGAKKPTEGAFYVWKKETIDQILGDKAPIFEDYFGVKAQGNVNPEHDAHNELKEENQLYITMPIDDLAKKHNISTSEAREIISISLATLKKWRDENRPRPHLDDKIVTAWNGLMLTALARAVSILPADAKFPDGSQASKKALEMADAVVKFTKEQLWDEENKELCRSWREGRGPNGMCEDYASMIAGLLDIYEATGNEDHLLFAYHLQKRQNELFWDEDGGGYYASPAGDSRILVRLKDSQDGAEPSALSLSVSNLFRLSGFITEEEYDMRSKAERTLTSQVAMIERAPHALGMMVGAAQMGVYGMKEVIVTGLSKDNVTTSLLGALRTKFVPNRNLIFLDFDALPKGLAEQNEVVRSLVESLASKPSGSLELPEVRICEEGVCGMPLKGAELDEIA